MSTVISSHTPAGIAVLPVPTPLASAQNSPFKSELQPGDQFNRNFPSQSSSNKNSSVRGNQKLWMGVLPLTGIAAIFTDWRTALNKIKPANPIKSLKEVGRALNEMGKAILKFFGKILANIFDTGFYAPDLVGYLLEAGFHSLKFLADIPFAIFG